MDLVTGAMGSLIPKLLQLLGDEYKLQTGTKKEVQFLTRELESIHAFLRKVSDVPWDQLDEQVKVWAREAREASYDMEDVIDTFLVHVDDREPGSHHGKLNRAMKKMGSLFGKAKARHDIGCAIQDIVKQLQEVADRRARYRIDDIVVNPAATTTSAVDPRLHAMYREVASLVGIEEPSNDLIAKLSVQGDDVALRTKIVAIVGIGGLGKTTLAKAVYDKLRAKFDCGAFVPVGRNPNLTKVLMDILYELDKNKYADIHIKNRDERQLIDDIREFLVNKRYFIVIDDLWEKKSWNETIELALLKNDRGSRLIITTRNSVVAEEIGDEVYRIQKLSDDNSKRLFYTRIFGDKWKCAGNQPDEIANKILKKCDGIPLAIITMASLLVGKPRERWSDMCTSIGFSHDINQQVENTMKILSFSYYDMPSHLRTCLLYLSVFPEDCTIRKDSLIWKWIAEGFIQEQQGISLFELGERYFNDLVNRSMIQAIEDEWNGQVDDCRVHDMILDLICSLSSKENFVTILDSDKGSVSPLPNSVRRVAQHNSTMEHTSNANMVHMPQVRSFVSYRCYFGKGVLLSSFKLLRVLDIHHCKNVRSSHLVHLGNLLHLRYLGLDHTKVDGLPDEIGALKLLHALSMRYTQIKQLPHNISRLTQLVCLNCRGSTVSPNCIGMLTSLEELQGKMHLKSVGEKDLSRGIFKELGCLSKLRVLRAEVFGKMDDHMERDLILSLRKLDKLQKLDFWGKDYNLDASRWSEAGFVLPQHLQLLDLLVFRFSWLPLCISSAYFPNLTHLSLDVDAMDQKGLEFIARLPELFFLCLYTRSTITISNIRAGNAYFRKLRFCSMPQSMIQFQCKEEDLSFHIWNGKDAMPFGSGKTDSSVQPSSMMPNLELLKIKIFVRALKEGNGDYTGLQYLPSLQKVKVIVDCAGASLAEVDEAEAALRKATEVHPNRPTFMVEQRWNKMQAGEPMADEDVTKSSIVGS